MIDDAIPVQTGSGRNDDDDISLGAIRLRRLPASAIAPLIAAGAILGVMGDTLLRAPGGPVALNLTLWIASVALAAVVVHWRAAPPLDGGRVAWLVVGVLCAAGLTWRDAPPLKLLALGAATLAFALAAHRVGSAWIRRAGVLRYAGALALGALHAWTATLLVLFDAMRPTTRNQPAHRAWWRRGAAIARGLAIAAPLVVVFGALFMSADAVFAGMVSGLVRFDFEWIAGHVLLFSVTAWISTGYLRGFMTGTDLLPLPDVGSDVDNRGVRFARRLSIGITEIATAMAAIELLFLVFVLVQFRYLFGGDALVQVTPDLTYAEYARHGFFELVAAVVLVLPILLAADWLLDARAQRDVRLFRGLAGVQIGLVLAIMASAFQRLRLYHASYGFTEARLYGMVLLIWIGAVLVWLAATVLRGRRRSFAFGTLVSGLATLALLFVLNPDAMVVRANAARVMSGAGPAGFDAAYAMTLSADAVPAMLDALPAFPRDVQCRLARHMLRQWSPARPASLRSWNWSVSRAMDAVRANEARLLSMVGPDRQCATPGDE